MIRQARHRLAELLRSSTHPPLRDPRFWQVQVLVVLIAAGHELADAHDYLHVIGIPSFATVGLFLIPIIYAALNFGLPGSFATASWVTILSLPDFHFIDVPAHHWMDGIQLAIIDAVAVFVGQRVERERLARQRAEAASDAFRKAEERYRGLFRASPAPILLVDRDGGLREANPATYSLFGDLDAGYPVNDLLHVPFSALSAQSVDSLRLTDHSGQERELRPFSSRIDTEEGPMVQVLLQDVTEELQERQRLAAYAAHVVQVQEEERRRIGQELHDEPLQALIQIYRQLAARHPDDRQTMVRELGDSEGLLARVIQDLRKLAQGLRPPALDDLGVVAALRRLAAEFAERNALEVDFKVDGVAARLTPELELSLFRIAQEALRNVERHAAARHVWLRAIFGEKSVGVEIEDDGIGFETDRSPRVGGSLGLIGMRERAQLLGGTLTLRSAPERGTLVHAEFPRGDPAAPADGRGDAAQLKPA